MQILQILTCPICLQEFSEPINLSCGHTFCSGCLSQLLQKQQFPTCPMCRKPTFAPVSSEWVPDDLLVELIGILKQNGEQVLHQEFPQIVMCLDCGLTPISPVVLPCQHLFCQGCLVQHLQNDLICPACNEWATFLQLPVNTKYQELIDWYNSKIENTMEEEQKEQFETVTVQGMPIFFFDQLVHHKQRSEIMIVEERYIQLLKIVTNGSGHFPIITLLSSQKDLPMFADLVQVTKVSQLGPKQIFTQIQGSHRVIIKEVYTIGQNGEKIPFTMQLYKNLPGQLWMSNFEILHDKDVKNSELFWNKIQSVLQAGFEDFNPQLREVFLAAFQMLYIFNQKKGEDSYRVIEEASLVLLRLLKISYKHYIALYYGESLTARLNFIWEHFQQIEQQLYQMLGTTVKQQFKEHVKHESLPLKPSYARLPIIDLEEPEDDNELSLIQYKDLTLSQQIFLNLFKIEVVIQQSL